MSKEKQTFQDAVRYLPKVVKGFRIPLTKADIMLIRRFYLQEEFERYSLAEEVRKPAFAAARYAVAEFCKDFGMEEYVIRVRTMDQDSYLKTFKNQLHYH